MKSKTLFYFLSIFEIFFCLFSQIVTVIFFKVFLSQALIHINLRQLLKCSFLYYLSSEILRLIVVCLEIWDFSNQVFENTSKNYLLLNPKEIFVIFDFLRLIFLISLLSCLITIVFERILATIKLKTYEKLKSNLLVTICILYHILPSIGLAYAVYKEIIGLTICGIIHFLNNISFYFTFLFLEKFNNHRYRISLLKSSKYTLSERFQLQENIRIAFLVQRFAAVLFILNLFVGSSLIISDHFIDRIIRRNAYVTLNYSIHFYGLIFPFMAFFIHGKTKMAKEKFKTELMRILIIGKRRIYPCRNDISPKYEISCIEELRSFNGNKLIFTIEEQREIAFKQLDLYWI